MAIVRIDKTIALRLRTHDGLSKALAEFVYCAQRDLQPPRIYKPSGVAKDGSLFQPYLDLCIHHHHLHRSGEPLLVTQHVGGIIQSVAISTHADHFQGDKMLWLKTHADAIDWTGYEELEEIIQNYQPPTIFDDLS